jgi:hypothetical protein
MAVTPSEVLPAEAGPLATLPSAALAAFRRHPRVLPLVVLSLVVAALWVPRRAGPLDLRWDGSAYYVLGTSLAEGKGYRLLNEPGEIEACQYPPLLPLIAAAPQAILGTSDPVVVGRWLKLVFLGFHAALAIASFLLLDLFAPGWLAFLGALALLLNAQVTFHSNLFFTEIPYALLTVIFVLLSRGNDARVRQAIVAAVGVAAFLLRTAGIALLAAWVAESLLRKRFKTAAVRVLVAAIPFVAWNAYVHGVEHSPQYLSPAYSYQRAPYLNYNVSYAANIALDDAYKPGSRPASPRELLARVWQNARRMPIDLGEAVSDSREYWEYSFRSRFPGLHFLRRWGYYCPLLLLGGLILGGLVVLVARRDFLIPVYVAAALALICVTPWPDQFRRYLTTLMPFLLVALFVCLQVAGSWLRTLSPGRFRLLAAIGLIVVLGAIFDSEWHSLRAMYRYHLDDVTATARDGRVVEYRAFYHAGADEALDEGLAWLKRRARPEDVVAVSMPQWAYLLTGLKAVRPPLEPDPERAQALLDGVPTAYLVLCFRNVGSFNVPSLLPVVEGHRRAWSPVYRDKGGEVTIYERARGADRDTRMSSSDLGPGSESR